MNELFNKYGIECIHICQCGAYTIEIDGKDYSINKNNFFKKFPCDNTTHDDLEFCNKYVNCNHCVNNWGLDLCACGSGDFIDECIEEFEECGKPMQSIEEQYNHVVANGGFVL